MMHIMAVSDLYMFLSPIIVIRYKYYTKDNRLSRWLLYEYSIEDGIWGGGRKPCGAGYGYL